MLSSGLRHRLGRSADDEPIPLASLNVESRTAPASGNELQALLINEASVEAAALAPSTPSSLAANVTGAFLSCFLTATGGISLGTVIFPPGIDCEWLTIGMSIGLLTAFVANVALSARTKLPVGVGGTLIPAITVLSDFFANEIGPDEPDTILMALAVNTLCFGVLVYIAGRIGVSGVVKACPYAVFVGFLGYTGISLLFYAVQIADPEFHGITDANGYATLSKKHVAEQVLLPIGVAIAVALVRRDWDRKPQFLIRGNAYIVPIVALLMSAVFYLAFIGSGGTLKEARASGWVFSANNGTRAHAGEERGMLQFINVWVARDLTKVKWRLLASSSFVVLILKTFVIGLLTLVEDVFATLQVCTSMYPEQCAQCEIDDEVKTGGIANVILALVGGLPANVVFSYSATVARIGSNGKGFYILQVGLRVPANLRAGGLVTVLLLTLFQPPKGCLSLVFFVFGNQLVAVMPKMVPAFLLFWVGLELAVWAVWDLRPHRRKAELASASFSQIGGARPVFLKQRPSFDWVEYLVVWAMALIGCVLQSSGMMMAAGLLFAFLITLWRLRNASIVQCAGNLQRFRSVSFRTAKDASVIETHGDRTQIIVLASCSLSFHNVAALVAATENAVHCAMSNAKVAHVIIDFARVVAISFDSCQTFTELLEMSEHHRFTLIFTGLKPTIASALLHAGVPMSFETMDTMLTPDWEAPTRDRGGANAKQNFVCCPIDPLRVPGSDMDDFVEVENLPIGADLNTALMACESDLLRLCDAGTGPDEAGPTDAAQNKDQKLSRMAVEAAISDTVVDGALLPVFIDIYNWSNGYLPEGTFEPSMLAVLSHHITVREYNDGETVYAADWTLPRAPNGAPSAKNTPPLIWVLQGIVEHRWGDGGPNRAFGSAPSRIASGYGIATGGIIEHAELIAQAKIGTYSIGPLATQTAFFGCMPHVGILTATAGAGVGLRCKCAVLTRAQYDIMRDEAPAVVNLLEVHCARKRWDGTSKAVGNVGNPKLVI